MVPTKGSGLGPGGNYVGINPEDFQTIKIKLRDRAMPTEARSNFMSRPHADTHFKTNTRAADDCELYKDGAKGRGLRRWEFDLPVHVFV